MSVDTLKYSVLMSVYAKENPEFLRKSMMSMYDQTIPTGDFVLVCDGPLTDDLDKVIGEMQKKFGMRMRVKRLDKNHGLGYALRLGVKECRNELIVRMDSDDISVNNRVEKQLEVLEERNVDVVGSNIIEYDDEMKKVFGVKNVPEKDEDIKKYAKRRNPMNHMSVCFKKSKVMGCGNYMDMLGFEDYYLWVRMIKNGCEFYNIQNSLVKVRGGSSAMRRRGGKNYVKNMIRFERCVCGLHFISRLDCVNNIIIRAVASSVSNNTRTFLYGKLLRKRYV